MFSSLGLFKHIACPKQDNCTLPSCIFLHVTTGHQSTGEIAALASEYDPLSAGTSVSPPAKRRKVEPDGYVPTNDKDGGLPFTQPRKQVQKEVKTEIPDIAPTETKADFVTSARPTSNTSTFLTAPNSKPKTTTRPVSPPPKRLSGPGKVSTPNNKIQAEPESLVPRNVSQAPAQFRNRMTIVQSLHQQMAYQNRKIAEGDVKFKTLGLTEQELITWALDEEEDAAKRFEPEIYRSSITQRILKIKKMTQPEWRLLVMERRNRIQKTTTPGDSSSISPVSIDTGLSSTDEEIAVLRHLRTRLEGLEKYGYVTSQPSEQKIAAAKAAHASSAGWEVCDRCGTRFQVFPGRDEDGRLTTKGPCRYHPNKPSRSASQKTDRVTGQAQMSYSCCNQLTGSEGCMQDDSHVFKVTNVDRLASILQFEHTPNKGDIKRRSPVSFDCEMGYTTIGLEVIRVTAVSWPEANTLLDVLVRPYGEVLDLNTRFSGVTKEQFADAIPYGSQSGNKLGQGQLHKVESPQVARQLLFELLSPETPLIGHAIDNDLNVVRIIHPLVIDTVLLYPHPRGLPIRHGLKALTGKYLHRAIQTGGEAGHDSREDAVATGDLVRLKIAEKWKNMKLKGWTFEDGILVAPEEVKGSSLGRKAVL